ncbi:MAG TPA: BTAD domain-containing putative transcriptional regulator, partial [Ilumatobacteraceae bacterium]|nr:BTAD domain-containing putative transcriptional regulator [Ilumatobacteraceae bacterium]
MRISLLGELEVFDDDGAAVAITGAKQRILLAVLALSPGRVVPTDVLAEAIWGADPPPAVRNGLQGLVSKVRRVLGSTDVLALRAGGYALDVPPEDVDVHRFEQLVAQGRAAATAGDAAVAADLLADAEALWRGDALADFVYEDFSSAARARLGELRLEAIEERLDAEVALGRPGTVAALESLVAAHPLRERLRALLMLALYRAGRQSDALRAYRDGRMILGEELGLDPGPELRRLETAILAQDPTLDGAPRPVPDAPASTHTRRELPAARTPLIGREHEVQEVSRLAGQHRLLTLVGPGGVGKTRVALEAARRTAAEIEDGAVLVELAAVGDPAAVRAAVTAGLGLTDPSRLAAMIGDRELLVVLDNCEHVIDAAAEVADDLLSHCSRLRLLATSREGLRIDGEVIWPVPPLATGEATALFVARATAAGASLDHSEDVARAIGEICTRLDGLPLAIELAAARTRAFPPAQVLARLHDRFRLLTGGSRTALPRQQTLRAVVDWSYDLLFDDEQRVFTRLSVFPAGCDLATVQAVCADGDLQDVLDPLDVEDLLQALVDKSLISASAGRSDVRYTQLQTLAHYGREKLAERGEAEAVRKAMAAHFARLCSQSTAAYVGESQRRWLITVGEEVDNLRAALEWAVDTDDAETALTIAGGVSWAHWLAGTAVEGKRWLDQAFSCSGDVAATTRAVALAGRALINVQVGAADTVDADFEAALELLAPHGDVAALAFTHSFYVEVAAARGDVPEARRRRRNLLAFYESLPDDPFTLAARSYSRAKLARLDDDLVSSERWYRAAADGFARIERPMMHAMCLGMVADFDERAGALCAADAALTEAIDINDTLRLRGFNAALLARLGWVRLRNGEPAAAAAAYQRALDLARPLHNRPVIFHARTGMAVLHLLAGRSDAAREAAREALDLHLAGGPPRLANRVDPRADALTAAAADCSVLACVAADNGHDEHAARLLGHAHRLRAEVDARLPVLLDEHMQRAAAQAAARLGPDVFTTELERGERGELGT